MFFRLRSWSRSGRNKESDQQRSEDSTKSRTSSRSRAKSRKGSTCSSLGSLSPPPQLGRICSAADPHLPVELEKIVFEWAARTYPETMPNLMLTCRRTHQWIEPILYELVTLYFPRAAERFISTINSKPHGWFTQRVKTLCLTNLVSREQASYILSACDRAENLACWIRQAGTVPCIEFLQPYRLSMTAVGLWTDPTPPPTPDFESPLFRRVTHLDLTDSWELWTQWSNWHLIPNLTHLELRLGSENDYKLIRPKILHILSTCEKLKVLALLVSYQPGCILGLTAIGDPRCVFLRQTTLTENWEAHTRGFSDRWSQAGTLVKAQRRTVALHARPCLANQCH